MNIKLTHHIQILLIMLLVGVLIYTASVCGEDEQTKISSQPETDKIWEWINEKMATILFVVFTGIMGYMLRQLSELRDALYKHTLENAKQFADVSNISTKVISEAEATRENINEIKDGIKSEIELLQCEIRELRNCIQKQMLGGG